MGREMLSLYEILNDLDSKGYLKHRESSVIEFKENFSFSNLVKYAKTMVAFANNKGGYIVFGIKDGPRIPIGINREKFNEIKQERITDFLIEYFSPEIKWKMGIIDVQGKSFGYIYVEESSEKPVVCRKSNDKGLKSGEIYHRYRGQTRKIEYPELKKIIEEYREKERQYWMKHIERIAKIGPQNVALIDLLSGSINTVRLADKQIIIDKALLDELRENVKFIEEGRFSETEGEPTLKLVGEIKYMNGVVVPDLDPNKDYPYLQKQLAEELNVKQLDVRALVWKLNLKGNKRYHIEIQAGKYSRIHKFSKYALEKLREELSKLAEEELRNLCSEYYRKVIKKN
ncbi:ATP-binding protein [Desulfurobacterium crinifex]